MAFENMLGGADPNALAIANMAPPQMPQQQPKKRGINLGDILGTIGDALLIANGRGPVYAASKQQRQQQEHQDQINAALANYMDDPENSIRALLRVDAPAAIQLLGANRGKELEIVQELKAAGIDPQSEEGRSIIRQHIGGGGGQEPNFVRELQAIGIDPHSDQALELYYGRNSPAGYLLRPPSRGGGASGPAVGTVVSGFRFRGGNPNDKANWEPVNGGQTASPSGVFPH